MRSTYPVVVRRCLFWRRACAGVDQSDYRACIDSCVETSRFSDETHFKEKARRRWKCVLKIPW